jgi:hypothetical protein
MIETQPNYKHHFRERRAMLETALKMIAEGKYQNSPIREIAFHARLAESTALHFYPTSNFLLQELELYSIQEVNQVVQHAMESSRIKQIKLLNTWRSLYKFFLRNPGVFKFIDQSTLILKEAERIERLHDALNSQLLYFFESENGKFNAQKSAAIFQMHIASAVKIHSEQRITLSQEDVDALATSCWMTLKPSVKIKPRQALILQVPELPEHDLSASE